MKRHVLSFLLLFVLDDSYGIPQWQIDINNRTEELQRLQAQNAQNMPSVPGANGVVGFPQTFQDLSKESRNELKTEGYKPYADKSAYRELNVVSDPNAKPKGDIEAHAAWSELDCRDYGWNNIKYGEKLGDKHKLLGPMSTWFRDANIESAEFGWCEGQEEHADDPCYCEDKYPFSTIEEIKDGKVVSKYVDRVTDDMFVVGVRGTFQFYIRDKSNLQFQLYGAASCSDDKNTKPKYRQTNGQYCFCKPEFSFKCTDKNGCSAVGDYADHYQPTYADWVYMGDKGTTQNCVQSCAKECVRASTLKKPGFYYYPEGYKQELGETRTGTVTVSGVTWYSSENPYGKEGTDDDKQRAQDAADMNFGQD